MRRVGRREPDDLGGLDLHGDDCGHVCAEALHGVVVLERDLADRELGEAVVRSFASAWSRVPLPTGHVVMFWFAL